MASQSSRAETIAKSGWPRELKVVGWIVGGIMVLAIGAAFCLLYAAYTRDQALEPLRPHLKTYLAGTQAPRDKPPEGQPRIKGKLIPVDVHRRDIDDLYHILDTEVRATQPEEVGTVALLFWMDKAVGEYEDGTTAYQQHCRLLLYYPETKTIVAEEEFVGSPPPAIRPTNLVGKGSSPDQEVAQYLEQLPRE
jgi:hypothetical protein